MALEVKTRVDGTRENHWTPLDGDETIHVIQTGPVSGPLSLADGTVYDVTPDHIQVHPHHVDHVNFGIAKMHEATGKWTVTGTPEAFTLTE